jgi:dihydropteroate synthase
MSDNHTAVAVQPTYIMGVLNATPDSFYGPSRTVDPQTVHDTAARMLAEGAHILDVGGESSRPGADPVSPEEELARLVPALEAIRPLDACVSVDTYRASTARAAIALGARMVNDITALRGDDAMAGVIAESGVKCVLTHMQGLPRDMQESPDYDDIIDDICAFFEERLHYATGQGIAEEKIWLDPGFGFGKTVQHNLTIMRRLGEFKRFGRPVLIGTSNKSTIGAVTDTDVTDRAEGTAATVAVAIAHGADAVRVHDVKRMARVARMADACTGRNHFE